MNQGFFTQLYDTDFHIGNLLIARQNWTNVRTFSMTAPRSRDALLLLLDCDALCMQEGKTRKFPKGALVHMAKGSVYSWKFLAHEEVAHTFLFEFLLKDESGDLVSAGEGVNLLFEDKVELFEKYFSRLLDENSRPRRSPIAVKAAAYRLLSAVIGQKYRESTIDVNTRLIAKGIAYLENDPYQTKSIAEVAEMCNMSVNYFERLFKLYAAETPSEYRMRVKIEHAKLLLSQNIMSIAQIADELGFIDSAYFCRIFRKKSGMTPKEYRNLYIRN